MKENSIQKILLIELCDYDQYPIGGQLSFAKNIVKSLGSIISIVGISTNPNEQTGSWIKKTVEGHIVDFFSCALISPMMGKPIIPQRIRNYLMIKRYCTMIFENNFDLVLIQSTEIALSLPSSIRMKTIIRMPGVGNGIGISRYKWARPFASLYERLFFKKVSSCPLILATADLSSIDDFIERSRGKIDKNKVAQFPSRYNGDIFFPKDKGKSREALSLSPQETIVVTVGRINWYKGWKFMIDSFIIFAQNNPNARLFFIGNGEDEDVLKKYIVEKSISDKVNLLGRKKLTEIALYLNSCDLFIMGSYLEGWSTTLVEAVASGTPCVVTEFSSAKELVKDHQNGFVVCNRDEHLFAQKMNDALSISEVQIQQASEQIKLLSVNNLKQSLLKSIYQHITPDE